jgi:hypothetical protein
VNGFLNVHDAAKFLCRSERWIRGNISWLPRFRVNGQILFREDELLKVMEKFREPVQAVDLDVLMRRAGIRPRSRGSKGRFRGKGGST